MSDQKLRIGITAGDFNGIGPEVLIGALADSRMSEMFVPVVYGSSKVLAFYKKCVEGAENFQFSVITTPAQARPKRVNLIECGPEEVKIEPGTSTAQAGSAAVSYLETAAADLKNGALDAVVTAPINKENVRSDSFPFMGHTDFFADRFGGTPLMMMCSELTRVGLATIHIPLSEVPAALSRELIVEKLCCMRGSLIQDFSVVAPRIAVLSLNPHSGDGGLIGKEEPEIIKPAIEEASAKGVLAFGPFAADGFFAARSYTNYDAVLAMYHDQGLTPFKALTPQGVNYTAGLDIVRTSPDHGVAYDIAGQGKADPASMREAIYAALDIVRSRRNYKEITANPLKRYERERGADMSVNDLPPEPGDE